MRDPDASPSDQTSWLSRDSDDRTSENFPSKYYFVNCWRAGTKVLLERSLVDKSPFVEPDFAAFRPEHSQHRALFSTNVVAIYRRAPI
jgi:hypothetical protein